MLSKYGEILISESFIQYYQTLSVIYFSNTIKYYFVENPIKIPLLKELCTLLSDIWRELQVVAELNFDIWYILIVKVSPFIMVSR